MDTSRSDIVAHSRTTIHWTSGELAFPWGMLVDEVQQRKRHAALLVFPGFEKIEFLTSNYYVLKLHRYLGYINTASNPKFGGDQLRSDCATAAQSLAIILIFVVVTRRARSRAKHSNLQNLL